MRASASAIVRSERMFFAFKALFSASAIAFIAFILLRRHSAGGPDLSFMPALNATFNALAALCLITGYVAVRRGAVAVHRVLMVAAFHLLGALPIWLLELSLRSRRYQFTGSGLARVAYLGLLPATWFSR